VAVLQASPVSEPAAAGPVIWGYTPTLASLFDDPELACGPAPACSALRQALEWRPCGDHPGYSAQLSDIFSANSATRSRRDGPEVAMVAGPDAAAGRWLKRQWRGGRSDGVG